MSYFLFGYVLFEASSTISPKLAQLTEDEPRPDDHPGRPYLTNPGRMALPCPHLFSNVAAVVRAC